MQGEEPLSAVVLQDAPRLPTPSAPDLRRPFCGTRAPSFADSGAAAPRSPAPGPAPRCVPAHGPAAATREVFPRSRGRAAAGAWGAPRGSARSPRRGRTGEAGCGADSKAERSAPFPGRPGGRRLRGARKRWARLRPGRAGAPRSQRPPMGSSRGLGAPSPRDLRAARRVVPSATQPSSRLFLRSSAPSSELSP